MKKDWDKIYERKGAKRNKRNAQRKDKAKWKLQLRETRLIKINLLDQP